MQDPPSTTIEIGRLIGHWGIGSLLMINGPQCLSSHRPIESTHSSHLRIGAFPGPRDWQRTMHHSGGVIMKFSVLFFDIYGLSMALHGLVFILQHLLCGSGMDSSRHHSSWHSLCYVSSSLKRFELPVADLENSTQSLRFDFPIQVWRRVLVSSSLRYGSCRMGNGQKKKKGIFKGMAPKTASAG